VTRAEFRAAAAQWRRWAGLLCLIGGAAAGLWLALCYGCGLMRGDVDGWKLALLFVAAPVQLGATYLSGEHRARRLRCPDCEKSLAAVTSLVLCSGHCPRCGSGILREPAE